MRELREGAWGELRARARKKYAGEYLAVDYFPHLKPVMVIDSREQKTTLLTNMYLQGVEIIFTALASADYLVTSEFGLERKNIHDLVQSVNSGRLQAQLKRMQQEYAEIGLIVENETQHWEAAAARQEEPKFLLFGAVKQKFATLLGKYKKLKLVKSHCPAHSAELIMALKREAGVFNAVHYEKQKEGAKGKEKEKASGREKERERGRGAGLI